MAEYPSYHAKLLSYCKGQTSNSPEWSGVGVGGGGERVCADAYQHHTISSAADVICAP